VAKVALALAKPFRKIRMQNTISFLQQQASGRKVALLFVLTMAVYVFMLAYSIPAVMAFAAGLPLFDLSPFGYSFEHANSLLANLGLEGRGLYLSLQLPIDFIYPALFAITYALILVWLLKKLVQPGSKLFYAAIIPVLAGLFDYLENLSIIKMINSYPNLDDSVVAMASIFTLIKSQLTTVYFIGVLIILIALLYKRFAK
jgi:hypothetical protein